MSFNVLIKQSPACAETGACNTFMKETLLDDIWWKMFNPASSDGEYDTAIPFRGPPESLQAAKVIVKDEYIKKKVQGFISKFKIEDD